MNERPTPESDDPINRIDIDCDDSCCTVYTYKDGEEFHGELVSKDFARRLERERDEAREQAEKVRAAFERCKLVNVTTATFWREDDEKMREAIREAHEALNYTLGDSVSFLRTTAIEKSEAALAKLQPFLDQ